jgi:hypothetical protein
LTSAGLELRLGGSGLLANDSGAFAHGTARRSMPNKVVDVILQFGAPHLEFFNFLIRREIDLFFDSIDFIIQAMVLGKNAAEMIVAAFQTPDGFAVFGKFPQDGMM